jgi:hypothetical protein
MTVMPITQAKILFILSRFFPNICCYIMNITGSLARNENKLSFLAHCQLYYHTCETSESNGEARVAPWALWVF